MGRHVTKKGMIRIVIATIAIIVAGAIYYPFSPGCRERQQLKTAIEYRDELRSRIAGQARFERVMIEAQNYSDLGVGIEVAGRVLSHQDLDELSPLITDEAPPVPVWWSLIAPTGDWVKVEIDFTPSGIDQ